MPAHCAAAHTTSAVTLLACSQIGTHQQPLHPVCKGVSLSVAPSADLGGVPLHAGCALCSVPGSSQLPRANWTERLTAPFKFGAQELLPSAVKLGSAVTLTAVMRQAASQLGRQLLGHHMRYQVGVRL